jgi:hypothetical protein
MRFMSRKFEIRAARGAKPGDGLRLKLRVRRIRRPDANDASDPTRGLREDRCDCCATGETGRVDPPLVHRVRAADVGPHRRKRTSVRFPVAVARGVVGAGDDPSESLGGIAEDLSRLRPTSARIENEKQRPFVSRVVT